MNATRPLILASLTLLLGAGSAAGWEYAYGPPFSTDQAFRRVMPVDCPGYGQGYLAVGTLDQGGVNPDVYAVFTNLAGNRNWEFSYDVEGLGFEDEGIAVAQLPNTSAAGGFVILSNTRNGVWRPALTRINCDGKVVWSQVYPDVIGGYDLAGRDLIRTANGDFAVAGHWFNGANDDAFLMRTDPFGALLWNLTYDMDGIERFNALTEAAPLTGQLVGDLVAVGRFNKINGDQQGLAARVNGLSGAVGPAPQCLSQHGVSTSQEVYHSVVPLLNNQFAGQFAMIGTTSGPGWLDDVWLSRGNPCALTAQSRIGNPLGPAAAVERGFDLREVGGPVIGPVGGQLAIAGSQAPVLAGPYEATFSLVNTANLLPVAGTGRIFGDHGNLDDVFYSLEQVPPTWAQGGFILAGSTQTTLGIADPQDLYLVQYNPPGPTAPLCEKKWSPSGVNLTWPQSALLYSRKVPARYYRTNTPQVDWYTEQPICP